MTNKMPQANNNIELAFLDDLTGIYNRRYLYKYLSEELPKFKKLALFMLDLDGFKKINDNYGHLEGDALLRSFSKAINESISTLGTVIRYAGDEFIVVLPEKEKDDAVFIAGKLVKDVSGHPLGGKNGGKAHIVTISLGLSMYPDDAADPENLIDKADQALYSSKRLGKNRFTTADKIIQDASVLNKPMKNLSSPKFINRVSEFTKLKNLLAGSRTEKIKAILINGEKGIGKTRLLEELTAYARAKKINFIKFKPVEEEVLRPYGVLINSLSEYIKTAKKTEVSKFLKYLENDELAEIVILSEAFKNILSLSPQSSTLDAQKKRLNLFNGLVKLFEAIAGNDIFMLAIDDLHWIDLASFSLLNHLLSNKKTSLFLCATYLVDTDKALPFWQIISKEENKDIFGEIILNPLTQTQVNELINAILENIEITPSFTQAIFEKTKGNPFFVEETLRLFIDKGLIYFKEGKWNLAQISEKEMTEPLIETQKAWLGNLDQESKEILLNAAFVGDNFNLDLLKQISQKNESQILDIIDKANKLGLVKSKNVLNDDEFIFSNGQIKEALSGFLDIVKAKELHKKIAVALEEFNKDDLNKVAGNILAHYKQAQMQNKVSEYSKKISLLEEELFSFKEAASYISEIPEKETLASLEEILEKPLSDKGKKILADVIFSLRSAIETTLLYPLNNQYRLNCQKEAYLSLNKLLETEASITLSVIDGLLLINGEELETKELRTTLGASFATFLSNYRIDSLTFKHGLTNSELAFFLETITKTEDYLNKMGGLTKIFKDNNITFIKINQVQYEKAHKISAQFNETKKALKNIILQYPLLCEMVSKGKEEFFKTRSKDDLKNAMKSFFGVIENITQRPGDIETKADLVLESVNEIAEPISKFDPSQWQSLKRQFTDKFLSLDPALKASIIKKEFYNNTPENAIINDIAAILKKEAQTEKLKKSSPIEEIIKEVKMLLEKENYKMAKEIIKTLTAPQQNRSVQQQEIINNSLENLIDNSYYDTVVKALNKDIEYPDETILGVLVELGAHAVSLLLKILEAEESTKDPFDLFVRRKRVAMILKKIGKDAVNKLKYKLQDQNPRLVKYTIEALGYIGDNSVYPELAALVNHPDQKVKEELIKTLGKLWSAETVKLIILLLKDKDSRVRKRATDTLIKLADKLQLSELEELLSDKDFELETKEIINRINKKYSS